MKICIVHASAGAGHRRAAEAIELGIKNLQGMDVVCVDSLDYTSPFFKKMYNGTYSFLVSKVSFLWRFFFWLLDIPLLQPLYKVLRRLQNGFWAKKLERYFMDEQFDLIISTHFMPNEVVSSLKKVQKIKSRLFCCVTDFDVHRIWLADYVDCYCVACGWTKEKLKLLGVNLEKIVSTGIPTLSDFSLSHDKGELKAKMGLTKDVFTILVATGSFGFGPIEMILKRLSDYQVVVVCGYNKTLYGQLKKNNLPKAKIFGHVNNMHELMAVSDVMITKPGGLSISEALVSQLPMIFFHPIPGQETNNIKVLNSFGIGTKDSSIEDIVSECKRLSSSNDTYLTALKKTNLLARPNAVDKIISLI